MKNLAEALSKFHDLMGGLEKDASNPFFKSKYVTLDNVLSSIKQPLKDAGLVFVQIPTYLGDTTPALKSMLIDVKSGENISEIAPLLLQKNDAQAQGSAITYMRRYALVSMLGLSTDTDDDGNSAVRSNLSSTEPSTDIEYGDVEGFNKALNQDPV